MRLFINTLCIFFVSVYTAFSQANVTFAAPSGYKLKVVINNQTLEDEQYIRFVNLNAETYTARITATINGEVYNMQSNISLLNQKETSYFIIVVNKTAQIHWTNETEIITNQPISRNQTYTDEELSSHNLERYGHQRYSQEPSYNQQPSQNGYSRPGTIVCDCNNPFPVLSQQEANRLKATVQQTSFDEDKIAIIHTALMRSNIMSADVRDLMRLLSFDHNRLKFAKRVYERTCDKQSYYIVSSAFDFSSNARELQRYLQMYR
ncbi:DUF4476 domain-containing protein [Xanthocytophaga flava]|uniref:DUF4476 domain-containing protein n=1 Tax=Xanthocytophaga flava TaxID=3048013 RepID=UPI0028D68811|nr:DUF4476 domain-containing protein [Xanthocytophaga flavus]MDJ1468331.1 DUF4476 domain-containing protein [Xanthocytophaga flavus]